MFGLDLLMPLIENSSNTWGTGEKAQEQARKDARYDYQENEKYGIMSRVEGAKAAGLHPLAALGFQAGAPSQVVGGEGTNTSGLSFGQRAKPAAEPDAEMRAAQLRLMNAQAADYETQAAQRSTITLGQQPGNPPVYPTDPDNLIPGQGSNAMGIRVVPNDVRASIAGKETGTHPTTRDFRLPPSLGGGKMTGLGEEFLKQTEDMELARSVALILANKERLGNFFTEDIPWAAKGWYADWQKARKARGRLHGRKPSSTFKGGASGNW